MKKGFVFGLLIVLFLGCGNLTPKQRTGFDRPILIVEEGDSFRYLSRVGEVADRKMNLSISGFYGIETLWDLEIKEGGEVSFLVHSEIASGLVKGVLVSQKGVLVDIFSGSCDRMVSVSLKEGGFYRFKLVGKNGSGTIAIRLPADNQILSAKGRG